MTVLKVLCCLFCLLTFFFFCRLKSHFEANPRDLDLLKHDKLLSKTAPSPHLRDIPEYLVDPKTQEASKMVKLARAAMGNSRRSGGGNNTKKKRSRKGGDPLKTFNANVNTHNLPSFLFPFFAFVF